MSTSSLNDAIFAKELSSVEVPWNAKIVLKWHHLRIRIHSIKWCNKIAINSNIINKAKNMICGNLNTLSPYWVLLLSSIYKSKSDMKSGDFLSAKVELFAWVSLRTKGVSKQCSEMLYYLLTDVISWIIFWNLLKWNRNDD